MMNVVVADGVRARVLLWQPRRDAWALTVVCKITFDLTPGVSPSSSDVATICRIIVED